MKSKRSIFAFIIPALALFEGLLGFNDCVGFRQLKGLDGQTCPAEHVEGETSLSNRTQCFILCSGTTSCLGVFFEQDTLKCTKCSANYSQISKAPSSSSTGSKFYMLTGGSAGEGGLSGVFGYELIDMDMTWDDAERNCVYLGGHLVAVKTSEEQVYLERYIAVNYSSGIWLGGKGDTDKATSYQWLDGTFVFSGDTNWDDKEPKKYAGTRCMKMHENINYKWKSRGCDTSSLSICKFE